MNYLIAILSNSIQAEKAYTALTEAGLPKERLSIIGDKYESVDALGVIDPSVQARKRAKFMAFWLVPFGFIGGYAFNLSTQFQLLPQVGTVGNQLIGALLGAMGGAMGSIFVGGGIGISAGRGDVPPYKKRVEEGRYIVIVSGPPMLTNQANRILRQFEPETLQGYFDGERI